MGSPINLYGIAIFRYFGLRTLSQKFLVVESVTTQSDSMEKTWELSPAELLKLFQEIGHLIASGSDAAVLLDGAAKRLVKTLPIDRCVFLLRGDEQDDDEPMFHISAEAGQQGMKAIGQKQYQLSPTSEMGRLMLEGKPIPLTDILATAAAANDELDTFVADAGTKSATAFPLVASERLIGCMTFHLGQALPEHILELGEAIAEELAVAVERGQTLLEREAESQVFRGISAPALILDRESGRIRRVNTAGHKVLAGSRKELQGLPLVQVMPDGQRVLNAVREVNSQQPVATVGNILVGTADGKPVNMDACISVLESDKRDDLLLLLMPIAKKKADPSDSSDAGKVQRAEELANTLTRQLSWERWVRQIICKLHATLDRDTLLQTVVDGFGRALGASRCLIVRTDGPAAPMVTHEYVEPDISPLGLGRTGQFPPVAVSFFKHKVGAIADLGGLEKSGELSPEDYEYFADNGIRSMAGAPITSHGIAYGVIIILESGTGRKWAPHELDMLEIAASQTAVALAHSQAYLQLKDQLFNMNLLGNLTQQLTNTLELVSRSGKADIGEEKARPSGSSPPLSLRELEVLKLIAGGLANREIAQRLFLTESTVELHASRIRKKLKLKSRTALVKYACDNGLA